MAAERYLAGAAQRPGLPPRPVRGTLEPPQPRGLGFLGFGTNWPGILLMAIGAVGLMSGASSANSSGSELLDSELGPAPFDYPVPTPKADACGLHHGAPEEEKQPRLIVEHVLSTPQAGAGSRPCGTMQRH